MQQKIKKERNEREKKKAQFNCLNCSFCCLTQKFFLIAAFCLGTASTVDLECISGEWAYSSYSDQGIFIFPTCTLWVLFFLQSQVFYQRFGSLRNLCCVLAVPRTALFWTEISDVILEICWSHSPSFGVTACAISSVTFTFLIFSNSSLSP